MANATDAPNPGGTGSPGSEQSMPTLLEEALLTPRRLNMDGSASSVLSSPQEEEEPVPSQQAMVSQAVRRRVPPQVQDGELAPTGRERGISRTPLRDQGNDELPLIPRRQAQREGQLVVSSNGMLLGTQRTAGNSNAGSQPPDWLTGILPADEDNSLAQALRYAREVRESRQDGSVQLVQQNVQVTVQHPPAVQNGLEGERMQLQMAAVQLQQYQAGLEQAAHQHGETLRAKMREVENMEYATQQEAVQQVRLFEENISREA